MINKHPHNKQLREKFFVAKRNFRKCLKRKSKQYHAKLPGQLSGLKTSNTKEYWNIIKQLKSFSSDSTRTQPEPDPETLFEHYKK